MKLDLDAALSIVDGVTAPRVAGRVTELIGLVLRATAPGARAGELVIVERTQGQAPLKAEVVGFHGEEVVLLPLGTAEGVGPDSVVRPTGKPFSIRCGAGLLGRVVDALGEPMDGLGPLEGDSLDGKSRLERWAVERAAPDPLRRRRVTAALPVGLRAIDGALTLGEGQRVGLFAGPGLGKSTLLGQIARHAEADVIVIGLVGERGREVRDFLETQLDERARKRAVCVCATSDAPPLLRLKSAFTATAVAEYFRDRGQRVLLLVDSLTRVARAQREVGLAAGEPPARQGYPPSVFAMLPRLLERSGQSDAGSITAVYAILTAADDADDPIADEVRAILDGHIVLSRELASRGLWPAVDVVRSLSRVMDDLVDAPHRAAAARLREVLAVYERQRDLVLLGAYREGADPATDDALRRVGAVENYLRQAAGERSTFEDARRRLIALFEKAPA
ncbi:MAG TPA: FliI/YscN family ATPase [Polyangia bacterium]|nr:FliI/YscN family ATPase [Polyangia bacterium]